MSFAEAQTSNSPTVVEQIEIAAPPARVYDALVSAEQLGQWWGSTEMYRTAWDVDLRAGGEYLCRATAPDGSPMAVRGRFLEVERPTRLSYTWNASWDPPGETVVTYELAARGAGTLVRVTHRGIAPESDRQGYQAGWGRVLGWLAQWVERGATS